MRFTKIGKAYHSRGRNQHVWVRREGGRWALIIRDRQERTLERVGLYRTLSEAKQAAKERVGA